MVKITYFFVTLYYNYTLMQKYFIQPQLDFLHKLKTTSLTAEQDLSWYRFLKTLQGYGADISAELTAISQDAANNGVVFMEDGHPDEEKSDKAALDKANRKMELVLKEDVHTKVLDIETLNKVKRDNEIEGAEYFLMLERYLKEA